MSKRLAVQQPGEPRHVVEIATSGFDSFDPAEVANAIMTLVAAQGWLLQETPDTAITQPGQWQWMASSAAHGPAGRLRVHLRNADEVAV